MSERVVVEHMATGASRWPTWVSTVAFLLLALGFALEGSLDDWLRAMCALAFTALALANGAKLLHHYFPREGSAPLSSSPSESSAVDPVPPEWPGQRQ
jgi:hypothetical protein